MLNVKEPRKDAIWRIFGSRHAIVHEQNTPHCGKRKRSARESTFITKIYTYSSLLLSLVTLCSWKTLATRWLRIADKLKMYENYWAMVQSYNFWKRDPFSCGNHLAGLFVKCRMYPARFDMVFQQKKNHFETCFCHIWSKRSRLNLETSVGAAPIWYVSFNYSVETVSS